MQNVLEVLKEFMSPKNATNGAVIEIKSFLEQNIQ